MKVFFIYTILTLSLFQAFTQEKIITAAGDEWPPYIDPINPTEGLSLEIVRAAYKTQGYEVSMSFIPWVRAMEGAKNGLYDILPDAWYSNDRAEYLLFSEPYAINTVKFIAHKDSDFEYNGIDSLKGKTIGIMRGYAYSQELNCSGDFQLVDANTLIKNIERVIKKRIDLTVEDEMVAIEVMRSKNPEYLNEIKFCEKPLAISGLRVASSFANPRHKELVEAFNRGLKEIISNGTYLDIMGKYGIYKIEEIKQIK